jgi:hypothetical protein
VQLQLCWNKIELSQRLMVCLCTSSSEIVDSGFTVPSTNGFKYMILTDLDFELDFFALLLTFGDS